MTDIAFAIDPGSTKCGVALVQRQDGLLNLLMREIVPTDELTSAISRALEVHEFRLTIVGSGTKSQAVVHRIREEFPSMGILVIDEKDTTMQARERYWEHHRRRGWRRILPSTLQVPPEPVDDFVALILAERVLLE